MLKTSASRTMRSNSLNVPDGAVALSIQIPDTSRNRKGSICSCSKCSWVSETDQPLSGRTSSTDIDSISQMSSYSRPHSECNCHQNGGQFTQEHLFALRSVSADFVRNPSLQEHSPSPPTDRAPRGSVSRSSISPRPSLDSTSGQISFKLSYNLEMGSLDVLVVECRDLPHFGKHNPNPVVHISLLPDDGYLEHSKVKTKVKRNTHSPEFREILKFPNLTKFELDDRSLYFAVYHVDPFSRKALVGEVEMRVEDYPWASDEPMWMPLRRPLKLPHGPEAKESNPDIHSRRGVLSFELSFWVRDEKLRRGDIHFVVKTGASLTGDPPILAKMPFVKANLLSNRKVASSAKSAFAEFKDNGLQPVWNYDIVIQNQSLEKMKKRALEISVWDRENSINNRYIGRLLFYTADPKKTEKMTQTLWRQLIASPGEKFAAELQLQP